MIALLPLLDVVFVGIMGPDPGHVDRQILKAEPRLVAKHVTTDQLSSIAKRDDAATRVGERLGADGVIAGEIVSEGKHRSLRLVVYRANGAMMSLSETALSGRTLGKDDIEVLQSNLDDEIGSLLSIRKAVARKATKPPSKPTSHMDESDPFADQFEAPAKAPKDKIAVTKAVAVTRKKAPPPPPQDVDIDIDADAPPGLGAAPAKRAPAAAPKEIAAADTSADASETASAGDADAVSADEIAALNTGAGNPDSELSSSASAPAPATAPPSCTCAPARASD